MVIPRVSQGKQSTLLLPDLVSDGCGDEQNGAQRTRIRLVVRQSSHHRLSNEVSNRLPSLTVGEARDVL